MRMYNSLYDLTSFTEETELALPVSNFKGVVVLLMCNVL